MKILAEIDEVILFTNQAFVLVVLYRAPIFY